MSCSPYDLRDFLFDELTAGQHGEVRAHLRTCTPCATELDRLRSTHAALLTLRDEEIPQRIGFVSDKVFEPSPVRRWFAGFWTSAARIGFVSAAMLSAAILIHAYEAHAWRPAQEVHNSAQSPAITQAEIDRRVNQLVAQQVAVQLNAQLQAKISEAVTQAVADTEQRAQKRTNALLADASKRLDMERWALTVQAEQNRHDGMVRNADMVRASFGSTPQ